MESRQYKLLVVLIFNHFMWYWNWINHANLHTRCVFFMLPPYINLSASFHSKYSRKIFYVIFHFHLPTHLITQPIDLFKSSRETAYFIFPCECRMGGVAVAVVRFYHIEPCQYGLIHCFKTLLNCTHIISKNNSFSYRNETCDKHFIQTTRFVRRNSIIKNLDET